MSSIVSRGRPTDPHKQDEQKKKLIEATKVLMREKSYRSITIRELGSAANVNSAMINYYFGGKEELFLAAINDLSADNFSQVQKVITQDNPIRPFISFMITKFNEDTGLARFIHDEVLNDNSPLRDHFIAGLPSKIATMLPLLVEKELKTLNIKTNINVKYAAFNLVSMIILPYLGAPIRKAAWQISDEELTNNAWVEHLYQQFIGGITRG